MFVRMRVGEGGGRLCDWVAPARIDRCVTSLVNSGVANSWASLKRSLSFVCVLCACAFARWRLDSFGAGALAHPK